MQDSSSGYALMCVVANYGMGSKIVKTAKSYGVKGGTIFYGKGTAGNAILEMLGLSEVKKEIVLMVAGAKAAKQVLAVLNKEFKFEKPNHGIAFSTAVCTVTGASSCRQEYAEEEGANTFMYKVITVIVDKGKAEDVVEAAVKAGAKGGTIINARGSGIHETSKLFSMEIEPEKEIVMILSPKAKAEDIVASIRQDLKIETPGNGIVYVQDVEEVYGLYE
ncbi:MAG TPA: P-II family nitrogen regulator [Bacillota bacterium]|nr:P-II family nitrogen regulator [Bacillota bacterium]